MVLQYSYREYKKDVDILEVKIIPKGKVMRICLKCGDMFLASGNYYVLSRDGLCITCGGYTGFFENDERLLGYIRMYKPDLKKIRNKELLRQIRQAISLYKQKKP